jgi:hypothetical protein
MKSYHLFLFLILINLSGCSSEEAIEDLPDIRFQLLSIRVGTHNLSNNVVANMPNNQPIVATFSHPVERQTVASHISIVDENNQAVALNFSYIDQDKTISALPEQELELNTLYTINIGPVETVDGVKFPGTTFQFKTRPGVIILESLTIDEVTLIQTGRVKDISLNPVIKAMFSHPVLIDDPNYIRLEYKGVLVPIATEKEEDGRTLLITPLEELEGLTGYNFIISDALTSADERVYQGFSKIFYTQLDKIIKFPEITDEELLTLVQQQTFKYFWDFAHPASGMARERNASGDLVTSGGSGFGIMAIIVGIERGFISRNEGVLHLEKIIGFLENADRFHGAWSHWINGNTGKVIPFSQRDNGGDIVETSFLIQGLIAFRQYLDVDVPVEKELIDRINLLWRSVEWNWYTKSGEKVLYWHWSPNFGWEMNHPIRGYNESLITYVLAAASPTHPIDADVYHEGWARNGNIRNGREFYDIRLPLGYDFGGPLFFAHYSFLGLDPRNLKDQYANYWEQNVNHSLINWSHSVVNPNNYVGYSEKIWGLTASDNQTGYSAHSPTNDLGVITPTAAISSIPYTPEQSMDAIRSFYYFLGDRLWGPYGFYDAFNPTAGWYANSYLAIDQGPIVVMIENHRTGLLWSLFMTAPEVQAGLAKLGFN